MNNQWPEKHVDNVEPFFFIWCSKATGLNDGSSLDTGELQGATIITSEVIVPTGLVLDSKNTNAVTIRGISYAANTVTTCWLSAGTPGSNHEVTNKITTSDGRTLTGKVNLYITD